MRLIILCVLLLVPCVVADEWEDFTNNLATDLAPLITLFGERLTKQFLSESISLLDNIIFALSPLGVLTAVVSVIRVCGGSSLRAFIGRAQEGPAEAESELLPCVSESTAELFNEGGISRVFGRPKIVEIVMWENGNDQDGEKKIEIGTLREALRDEAWSAKGSGQDSFDPTHLPELDVPNLSLNKGIKRRDQFWYYCAAAVGVVLQLGVIIYAAITVFVFPNSFEKDDKPVPSYAFPFYMIGTIFLFMGMLFCAIVIARSSEEYYFKPNKPSKIFWLQPGKQNVGDQVFNAFMAVKEGPKSTMTKEMEYIKSRRFRKYDGRHIEIYSTLISTLLGFIFQFVGLRGLHASVILAQLGSTFIMSILRTCLRTERMPPEENKISNERKLTSHKQQELDCFAFHLKNIESFEIRPCGPPTSPTGSSSDIHEEKAHLISELIQTRARLAELTSPPSEGLMVIWDGMPIRKVAYSLARVIESTMDLMSGWGVNFETPFEFQLNIECRTSPAASSRCMRVDYPIRLQRNGDALRWSIDKNQLEAVLGLWVWSLLKTEENWHQNDKLKRLVGLTEDEASQKETYLLFHKWIFRQTEAKLVSSKVLDSSRRLFGFGTDTHDDILVVETRNQLERMAAQDLYVRFLQSAFRHFIELGGETHVSDLQGPQASFMVHNSRIDEMVHYFETCGLGSREDALLCIIPVLRKRNLLPEFSADSANGRKEVERFIRQGDWKRAFELVRWLCQVTTGTEFERSAYELGYLCRRALLDTSKDAQEAGLEDICRILDSDVETDFFEARRQLFPARWARSPDRQLWWANFACQVGWVAWHISNNVNGMKWIRPALKIRGVDGTLVPNSELGQSVDAVELGEKVIQDWIASHQVDYGGKNPGEKNAMGYKWALAAGHYTLLYFTLVRWIELVSECPTLIGHAYTVAAKNHCDWGVKVLRRRDANINDLNEHEVSALTEVVALQDLKAARILLGNGSNPDGNEQDPDQRPMLLAAHQGATEMIRLLLDYGANLEIEDCIRSTALHWAIRQNRLDTVRFLLSQKADIEKTGLDKSPPLHLAVSKGYLQMTEMLLDGGSDINSRDGDMGRTALMLAAMGSHVGILQILLNRGADIETRDFDGLSALDLARRQYQIEAVAILEEYHSRGRLST